MGQLSAAASKVATEATAGPPVRPAITGRIDAPTGTHRTHRTALADSPHRVSETPTERGRPDRAG